MSISQAMKLRADDLDTREKRAEYTIGVVGCGRIGLPTACLFAEAGFRIVGVDADPHVVSLLKKGRSPISEPGLGELLKRHALRGSFTATTDLKKAASECDIIVFVVPTVVDSKRKPDYSSVQKACRDIGMTLRPGSLVIFTSTVGPGITETLVKETLENASGLKAGADFGLVNSPTRASPGRVLRDIATYARILGGVDQRSVKVARHVLATITKGDIVEVSNMRTAETVKLFENAQRNVDLALANDFALFCERVGVDYLEVQMAANTQPYSHLLHPGLVGGHIPKDCYLLLEEAENVGARLRMLVLARRINDDIVDHTVQLVRAALKQRDRTFRRAKIALLGVSYRPNVKEPRGALSKRLTRRLINKGAVVKVYDPFYSCRELEEMGYNAERTLTKTVEGTDCIVIAVGHARFQRLNLRRLRLLMRKSAVIVDMGHVIDPLKAEKEGFIYRGVGRGKWTI